MKSTLALMSLLMVFALSACDEMDPDVGSDMLDSTHAQTIGETMGQTLKNLESSWEELKSNASSTTQNWSREGRQEMDQLQREIDEDFTEIRREVDQMGEEAGEEWDEFERDAQERFDSLQNDMNEYERRLEEGENR